MSEQSAKPYLIRAICEWCADNALSPYLAVKVNAQTRVPMSFVKNGEIVLVGAHITPLSTASTHVHADPTRTRKLLLHREEINRLVGKVERAGYTLAPINLHYKNGRIKLEVGLAKGKKQHDKRDAIKDRDWAREQQRLMRNRPGSART